MQQILINRMEGGMLIRNLIAVGRLGRMNLAGIIKLLLSMRLTVMKLISKYSDTSPSIKIPIFFPINYTISTYGN